MRAGEEVVSAFQVALYSVSPWESHSVELKTRELEEVVQGGSC